MARRGETKDGGLGRWFIGLLVINIVPVGALAWLGYALWSGQKTMDDLRSVFPQESASNWIHLGAAMVLMFLVGTLLVPLSHGAAKRLKAQLHPDAGRSFLYMMLWLPRQVLLGLCALVRTLGFGLGVASILFALLFVGRIFAPDLLADVVRMEDWVAWVRERV